MPRHRTATLLLLALVALLAAALAPPPASALDTAPFRFLHRGHPASAAAPHAVQEGFGAWQAAHDAPAPATLALTFAVRLSNLDRLGELLREVSDPESPRYGRHASPEELRRLVAPRPDHVARLAAWLSRDGAPECAARAARGAAEEAAQTGFVTVRCPLPEAGRLLGSSFRAFRHARTGRVAWRTAAPMRALDDGVAEVLDFVGGANTPLHGHRDRHGRVQAGWSAAAAAASASASAADADGAVTDGRVTWVSASAGLGTARVSFNLECANGDPSLPTPDGGWPCDRRAGDKLEWVDVTLTWPGGRRRVRLTSDNPAGDGPAPLACAPAKNASDPAVCSVTVGARQLPLYTPMTATVDVFFAGDTEPHSSGPYASALVGKEDVTPQWLAALYGVPENLRAGRAPNNGLALAEFLDEYYSDADLTEFARRVGVPRATVTSVVGPNNQSDPGGEATLDVDVVAPWLSPSAKFWFWSAGGRNDFNDEEPFLEWVKAVAKTDDGPAVWSISYGDMEHTLPDDYMRRVDAEFQKLGAAGVSILVSSGDDGSAGYLGRRNETAREAACSKAGAEWPAVSPYVTACGATQLSTQATPACGDRPCREAREVVCSSRTDGVITSGGGTSWRVPRPDWQAAAVDAHLKAYKDDLPPGGFFNAKGRAVPDWSAYGNNFLVVKDLQYGFYSGTSASTPLLASFVTLWNELRHDAGLPRLGFLNPLLYKTAAAHPEAFRDVVVGDTKCFVHGYKCCEHGFTASVGYDLASGLGTPRFDVFARLMQDPDAVFPGVSSAWREPAASEEGAARSAVGLSAFALVLSVLAMVAAGMAVKRAGPSGSVHNSADGGADRLLQEQQL